MGCMALTYLSITSAQLQRQTKFTPSCGFGIEPLESTKILHQLKGRSAIFCVNACVSYPGCKSVDYANDTERTCTLINSRMFSNCKTTAGVTRFAKVN